MILGLVMYLLVEDTGNIHAQCLDIMGATVRVHRPAQRQARQAKGKRESRYVIKVMRFKQGRGWVPLVRENQRIYQAF